MNAETDILSMTDLQHTALISGNKAMQLLELSRHSFEKVVKEGLLTVIHEGGKKYYQIGEIETFMKTDTYQELVNGVVDARPRVSFTKKVLVQIIRKHKLKNFTRLPIHSKI